MPEQLLVKCKKCGLVFDKLRTQACPICQPRIRPGSVPPPTATPSAEAPKGTAPAGAAGETAEPGRMRIPLAPVLGFALGALASLAYWNHRVGSDSLLAWPERPADAPAAAVAVPQRVALPVPAGVTGTGPEANAGAPLELIEVQAAPPDAQGQVRYTVRLANRAPNTVKELRIHGVGEDRKGRQLVTPDVEVQPSLLGGTREATVELVLPEGGTLRQFDVEGWIQHGVSLRPGPRATPMKGPVQMHRPRTPPDDVAEERDAQPDGG